MSESYIEKLVDLCFVKPFDACAIEKFIVDNNLNSEAVTCAAKKVCERGEFEYSSFVFKYECTPTSDDLITDNWIKLFGVLLKNGFDPFLVTGDFDQENTLESICCIDNDVVGPTILKNILEKYDLNDNYSKYMNFSNNFVNDFILDVQMNLYNDKRMEQLTFYYCLVLIGYSEFNDIYKCPVKMKSDYSYQVFRNFEDFDYKVIRTDISCRISIYAKNSGIEVGFI